MTETNITNTPSEKVNRFAVTLITVAALVFAVGFNLVFLYPEVTKGVIPFNDSVFHLLLAGLAADTITNGRDVTDPWQRTIGVGFPLFHHYQHLSHVVVGLAHVLAQGTLPLIDLMRWSTYLLLSVFPLSIYWSVRHFGFSSLTASMGALIASLAATELEVRGFGLDYGSYVFRGWGLYAQLWGMILLPPTMAVAYRVLQNGRGYFCATLLLSATLMSHLMYGYMAFVILGTLTVIQVIGLTSIRTSTAALWIMWRRLIVLLLLVVATTSYFLIPFFIDQQYVDPMTNMQPAVANALGHKQVIKDLIEGNLFDFKRFPSLTVLVFAGIGICLIRWREKHYLIPVSIFLLGLILYFGEATWGPLMDLLPMSNSLHVYRFIGLVHLGGLCLAAIALASLWHWAISGSNYWRVALAIASTLLLLLPAYMERQTYLSENSQVIKETRAALKQEENELNDLLNAFNRLPPGRTYAGEARDNRYSIGYTNLSSFLYSHGIEMGGNPLHEYSLASTFIPNFAESSKEKFDLFNVRYIISPTEHGVPDFAVPAGRFGRYHSFEIKTNGYFDVVESNLSFAGEKKDFYPAVSAWIESGLLKAKMHPEVSLGSPSDKNPGVLPLSIAPKVISERKVMNSFDLGKIVSETVSGHTFESEVIVNRDSTLLLKASYHPNFQATVNGVRQETVMLMPGFTGVELTPGYHEVRIEYRPRTLRKVLLGVGLLTLILILLNEKQGSPIGNWFSSAVMPKWSNLVALKRDSRSNRGRRGRGND